MKKKNRKNNYFDVFQRGLTSIRQWCTLFREIDFFFFVVDAELVIFTFFFCKI